MQTYGLEHPLAPPGGGGLGVWRPGGWDVTMTLCLESQNTARFIRGTSFIVTETGPKEGNARGEVL